MTKRTAMSTIKRGELSLGVGLEKFQPVAEGILGIETARARQRIVVCDFDVVRLERRAQCNEIRNLEGRMRFLRGTKVRFNADVELLISTLEPAAAASTKGRRLFDLRQAQNRAIKFPRLRFAAWRRGKLDMVNARNQTAHRPGTILPRCPIIPQAPRLANDTRERAYTANDVT